MFAISSFAKCDTIDYYSVYYNDTVWVRLNQYSDNKVLVLKMNKINPKDFISVSYWTDTPCANCPDSIEVIDDKNNKFVIYTTPEGRLSLSMNRIINMIDKGASFFKFYYTGNRRKNVLLFRLDIN
jgi:hypothetical protein